MIRLHEVESRQAHVQVRQSFIFLVMVADDMSGVFDRLIGGKRRPIRRVMLDGDLLDGLLGAAKTSYPREFGALRKSRKLTRGLRTDIHNRRY